MAYGSGSFSYGSQESQSGERYSPEALARIADLYPSLLAKYTQLSAGPQAFMHLGGGGTSFPGITTGGIWSPEQIQQRVNATRAQNDSAAANQNTEMATNLGGRGFSNNSPLYKALAQGNLQAALAANTQGENDLRWNAAQGNASHLLGTQQADVARSQAISEDQRWRKSIGLQAYDTSSRHASALLEALMSMNRPMPFNTSSSYNRQSSFAAGNPEWRTGRRTL